MAVDSTNGNEINHPDPAENGTAIEELPNKPPLSLINDELLQQVKIKRTVFDFLKAVLEPSLASRNDVDNPVSTDAQLCTAVQFLTKAEYDNETIGELPLCCIWNVIDCLVEIAPQFIKFPAVEELSNVKQQFSLLGKQNSDGFPNVIGIIDCSHVQLRGPEEHPNLYLNRYSQHSINVQFVCGPDLQIYNVFAAFPGSKENAYIWQNSNLRHVLAQGIFNDCWLIGGRKYPQEPWLMTPVLAPETAAEKLYNKVHTLTQKPIGQCLNILKSRFRSLESILDCTPARVCAVTIACCVLHNICLQHGDMDANSGVEELSDPQEEAVEPQLLMEEGVAARCNLIEKNFSL